MATSTIHAADPDIDTFSNLARRLNRVHAQDRVRRARGRGAYQVRPRSLHALRVSDRGERASRDAILLCP